jgi:hypothetical protein
MSRRHASALVAGTCLLLTGCGSSSPSISTGAGNTLRADVLALTQAAAAREWSTADQALAQLRSDLTAAVAAGGVSVDRARAIRGDVAAIAGDLAAHRLAHTPKTSSAPSTTKPEPAPKPPKPPKPHDDHGHGPGRGHGHEGEE